MSTNNIATRRPTMLLLVLLLLAGGRVVRSELIFEMGRLVHERVSSFMSTPTDVLRQLRNFRSNGAFAADLGAADRDAFFRLNFASMEAFPQMSMYYGLEDGTFAWQSFRNKRAQYREPGHSGYLIALDDDGSEAAEDPEMEKHYKACVNPTSGESVPCRMKPGEKYTECTALATLEGDSAPLFDPVTNRVTGAVATNAGRENVSLFDCALTKCADEKSQRICETMADERERAECQANVKWCSSYAIKDAPDNVTLGYVVRSVHCVDQTGVPTQTQGEVLIKDQKEGGSCYYLDGETLVERNLEGDFAYCGGNGNICNDTFAGAFHSKNYDPRWRGWYIDTKSLQKPNWSPPYPFFSTMNTGITFSIPIYTVQDDDRNVFTGVLAVDYTFNGVTNFLQDNFKNSQIVVTIFEQAEPHYMVASSTDGSTTNVVLAHDESQPCPNPEIRDGCKAVRVKVAEFSENYVAAAFARQQDEGFPEMKLVATKTNDEHILYATQTNSFSIEDAGLDWTIMTMTAVETEEADQIVPGNILFGPLVALSSFGFLICSTLAGLLIHNRTEREVVQHDWRFMSAFVGGCALLNASCLSFLGENTDRLCLTRMWLVHFFFVLTLSILFVKMYRMYKLVGSGFRRNTISHAQTARMTLPFVGVQTLILLVFTFVDPNKQTEVITIEDSNIVHRYVCDHNTPAFFITMLLYEGGLVAIGCVLAYKTRHLRDEFNESKQIILAMYDNAVIGSASLLVSKTGLTYQGEQRIMFTLGTFWTTCFASLVFVLPWLMQVKSRHAENRHGPTVIVSGVTNLNKGSIQNNRQQHATSLMMTANSDGKAPHVKWADKETSGVKDSEVTGAIHLNGGRSHVNGHQHTNPRMNKTNSDEEMANLNEPEGEKKPAERTCGESACMKGVDGDTANVKESAVEHATDEEVAPAVDRTVPEEERMP